MMIGEDLTIDLPVSKELLNNVKVIQDIFLNWYQPNLKRIELNVKFQVIRDAKLLIDPVLRTACFFSGGIDSWHTLLINRSALEAAIIIKGFDVLIGEVEAWNIAEMHFKEVCSILKIEGIKVETNIRNIIDPKFSNLTSDYLGDAWGELLHGGCLAAIGLLTSDRFSEILIASSYSYKQLHPWGSHPLIDENWSNQLIRFKHDSCGWNRMDKIKYISKNVDALTHL